MTTVQPAQASTASRPTGPHRLRGIAFIAAAAACWGASAPLGRAVFTGRLLPATPAINPLILAQTRVTFAALVLLPALLALRGRAALRLPAADAARALVLGALGISVSNYAYYLAIQKTSVAVAIVLEYTAPIWVLLYMVSRGRQKATWTRMAGVAAAFTGIALAIGILSGPVHLNLTGVTAALAAAVSFAFYNVYGHTLLSRPVAGRSGPPDGMVLTLYALAGGTLFWLLINPPWKVMAAHYTRPDWVFLFGFAMLSMLAPSLLYFTGLRWLDATRAIVTSCLEPVTGIVLATLFLGEPLGWMRALGVGMVLVAIVLIQRKEGAEE